MGGGFTGEKVWLPEGVKDSWSAAGTQVVAPGGGGVALRGWRWDHSRPWCCSSTQIWRPGFPTDCLPVWLPLLLPRLQCEQVEKAAAGDGGPGGEDVKGPHASLAVRLSQRDPGRSFVLVSCFFVLV